MAETFWDQLREASSRIFVACALALKLPRGDLRFFDKTFKKWDQCTLRFLHFPPCDFVAGDSDGSSSTSTKAQIRIGEHTDFGMVTLLFHDSATSGEGLQVKKTKGGVVGGGHGGEMAGPRDKGQPTHLGSVLHPRE